MDLLSVGFFSVVVRRVQKVVVVFVAKSGFNFLLANVERVRDIFQEDQAENRMFVNGCV